MEARVAVLGRPEAEGYCRQIIDQRNRVTVLGEVDGAQITLATLAALHANVRELLGNVNGQLVLALFTAGGTQNAPKLPLERTDRADERAPATVAFGPQHADDRASATKRADARRRIEMRRLHALSEEFEAGLEERTREKCVDRIIRGVARVVLQEKGGE